jgi:hypothetical protein
VTAPQKPFLGVGIPGWIGILAVVAAVVVSGLPQMLARFALELVRAAVR